ncbi:4Fe-4S dicluster domain-containing protein [Paludibacter sp. 221]|uniref:(Fe-S)-binding protein n=1 Tax=Paludibacter sp. 221 TaxID=2302939 RepID=UPI0013D2C617|nr:heterodisulfide reductase-related iron-sulfur binding cluster [Paludibacter sp. 221]NDV46910.1 4Fe-4S dicluster domain-containing protein [Paludibacter sp. 221]
MLLESSRTFIEFLQDTSLFITVKSSYFISFVVPFYLGCLFLFGVLIYKYVRWIRMIDKSQRRLMWRNIFSLKVFSAIKETFSESLFHRKIYKKNPLLGYMHMSLALGWFLMIVVGKIESSIYNRSLLDDPSFAIFFRYFVRDTHLYFGQNTLSFIMDFLLVVVLSGLALAIFKRFRSRALGMKKTTKQTTIDKVALTALWFIFPFRLLAEGVTAGLADNGSFLTQSVGNLFVAMNLPLEYIELPVWWAYSLTLCTFFACMPFSRYMHIFTEIVLIFLRNLGVEPTEKFNGYSMVQLNACSRCGICIDACQLGFAAGVNTIQPVNFVADTRYRRLTAESLNNCLMCDRCVDACPVGVESTLIRQQIRNKTSEEGRLYYTYDRAEKATKKYNVIYFAGCMTHLTPAIIKSMKKIFEEANERYWFMDEDKGLCCGRPLRQQGFLQQADELMFRNKELIISSGIKLLVTSCPICYKTFKNDYMLKDMEIMHHSEYIDYLIKYGRIKVDKADIDIVYHDPCELGRGCNIYDEPRRVLQSVGNLNKPEFENNKAYCCGNTLGNTLLSLDKQQMVRDNALEMLTKSNPDVLATACPLCKKTFANGNKVKVKDIAEIVAENLEKNTTFDTGFFDEKIETRGEKLLVD